MQLGALVRKFADVFSSVESYLSSALSLSQTNPDGDRYLEPPRNIASATGIFLVCLRWRTGPATALVAGDSSRQESPVDSQNLPRHETGGFRCQEDCGATQL